MLSDIVLEDAEILFLEVFVEVVKIVVVADFDSLAAVTALKVLHFAEYVLAVLTKFANLLLARLLELNEAATNAVFVELVELVLVLKKMVVGVVVQKSVELFAYKACNVGAALLFVEIIKRENLVVVVACAVFFCAVEHIKEDFKAVFARALVAGFYSRFHFSEACVL